MRALVARDLADAQVAGLSADRRFATAYNAALQTANMAIACAGYRVTAKTGHHKVTGEAITLAVRSAVKAHADYFRNLPAEAQRDRLHAVTRGHRQRVGQDRDQGAGVLRRCGGLDRIEVPASNALRASLA
jgi:hypothetical protein